jgi:hypothetical protein
MKITRVDSKINSTSDCLSILNNYKTAKWKRVTKFNLKSSYQTDVVRVFTDGDEYITLISKSSYVLFCQGLDLSKYKPIIDKINSVAKFYWTHDYGNIWFNPEEMKVWINGGDGGIYYSEASAASVVKMWDEGSFEDTGETPAFHHKVPELKGSTFEAEYDPEEYEGDEDYDGDNEYKNYILIGHINDICNFESDD